MKMSIFGGGSDPIKKKVKTPLGPSQVAKATPDILGGPTKDPYKMDSKARSNYGALQARKMYEGLLKPKGY